MEKPSPQSEEIVKIESALRVLLDQVVEIDMRTRVGPPEPPWSFLPAKGKAAPFQRGEIVKSAAF